MRMKRHRKRPSREANFNVFHSIEFEALNQCFSLRLPDSFFYSDCFCCWLSIFKRTCQLKFDFCCFLQQIQFSTKTNYWRNCLHFFSKLFFCSASLTFWMHKFTELRSVNRHWEEHTAPLLLLQFQHCCMDENRKNGIAQRWVDWRRNWIWHQETVVVVVVGVAVLFASSHFDTTVPIDDPHYSILSSIRF